MGSFALLDHKNPPDAIIILVGTNNIICSLNSKLRSIKSFSLPDNWKGNVLPMPFTVEGYIASLKEILQLIQQRAPQAKISIMTIPPIGEDLNSNLNTTVKQYNEALIKTIKEEFPKIVLIPLFETLSKLLQEKYTNQIPPAFKADLWDIIWNVDKSFIKKHIFDQPWNKISDESGLYLTVDHIHLNERAGEAMINIIESEFLRKLEDFHIDIEDLDTTEI